MLRRERDRERKRGERILERKERQSSEVYYVKGERLKTTTLKSLSYRIARIGNAKKNTHTNLSIYYLIFFCHKKAIFFGLGGTVCAVKIKIKIKSLN